MSTEDAIVELRCTVDASEQRYMVALLFDIFDAFDNVWWPLVLNSLRCCLRNLFKVMVSYFDRQVVFRVRFFKCFQAGNKKLPARVSPRSSLLKFYV